MVSLPSAQCSQTSSGTLYIVRFENLCYGVTCKKDRTTRILNRPGEAEEKFLIFQTLAGLKFYTILVLLFEAFMCLSSTEVCFDPMQQ